MPTAERMYLVHLQSGDTVSAQFNPTEFREALEVVWRELEVPGESHEPAEYDHTRNHEVKFDLAFDATSAQGISFGGALKNAPEEFAFDGGDTLQVRRWLLAYQYPMRNNDQSVRAAAPSRILVVWPGFYSLSMRLKKVDFTHRQWAGTNLPPILFTATLEFFADNDKRLYYEDVLAHGTERNDGQGNQTIGGL